MLDRLPWSCLLLFSTAQQWSFRKAYTPSSLLKSHSRDTGLSEDLEGSTVGDQLLRDGGD